MICGRKKILIVEDNADLCDLLTITIRRLGHEVAIAITGEEAVERASATKPDLILMDIRLPTLNGIEATKQIKADQSTKDIPVVILSAFSMSTYGRHAVEAGAVEVLQKPVSVTDIERVLDKYCCTGHEAQTQPSSPSVSAKRRQETSNIVH